jgi:hypothetical protein
VITLCCEELESRDCPTPVRTVVALDVHGLAPAEADFVRGEIVRHLAPHAPPGRLEVAFADGTAAAALLRADRRSDRLQAFVIEFSPGRGPLNWWGESGGSWGRVYVGGHRDLPPEQQAGQLAVTALHELGHCLGLGHPDDRDPHNLMSFGAVVPDQAGYPDVPVPTDVGFQNAARVVRRVLWRRWG